jgi:mono/diheme cytochrome c family protein
MWMRFAALSALTLAGVPAVLQETKKPAEEKPAVEFKIPPEEAKKENPVKPTAESVARGKRTFGFECAMCHGVEGDGKGDLAEDMKLTIKDFRDPATLKDMTDGEVFYIITKGKGKMPGEEDRMKPDQLWDMVNYVRSFAKKEPAPKPKTEKP